MCLLQIMKTLFKSLKRCGIAHNISSKNVLFTKKKKKKLKKSTFINIKKVNYAQSILLSKDFLSTCGIFTADVLYHKKKSNHPLNLEMSRKRE